MDYTSETILVTGAAGFIGSHVCVKLLGLGAKVVGVDNFDPYYARELKDHNLKMVESVGGGFVFDERGLLGLARMNSSGSRLMPPLSATLGASMGARSPISAARPRPSRLLPEAFSFILFSTPHTFAWSTHPDAC